MAPFTQRYYRRGMTLIEALIAVAIFTMIAGAVTALFMGTWRAQGFAIQIGASSDQAAHGVARITDFLRNARQAEDGAYPLAAVSASSIVFYANADGDPATERVHIWRDGGTIYQGIVQPSGTSPATYDAATETEEAIVTHVVDNQDASPLFTYYNESNEILSSPQVASVRMAQVSVSVDTSPGIAPEPIRVVSFASFRNLRTW